MSRQLLFTYNIWCGDFHKVGLPFEFLLYKNQKCAENVIDYKKIERPNICREDSVIGDIIIKCTTVKNSY